MVELTWDGKYDSNGKRTSPPRLKLPFQTVETINESAQQRQMSLDMFSAGRQTDWRNRLIWGDKKYVLPALLDEFAGKVDLIYIDPPFNIGANFSFSADIPDNPETEDDETSNFIREPSIIEQKAYRDTWGRGRESYAQWFYETVSLLRELLSDNGSIYLHIDYNMAHYCKVILDEVFGSENFRNEIIWKRTTARTEGTKYNHIHDTIYFYTKSNKYIWNIQYLPYNQGYLDSNFKLDEKGRLYRESPLTAPGTRTGLSGKPWKGLDPSKIGKGRHWAIPNNVRHLLSENTIDDPIQALNELEQIGRIVWAKDGEGRPNIVQYADEMGGVELQSLWLDFSALSSNSNEHLNYPTQKPELLLERIIKSSSKENDLILDCFCGSGTTAAVAEGLNRRWITCDLGRFAIHTARKRLLSIPSVKPFVVQNLGKYERQAWQAAEFGNEKEAAKIARQYHHFILDLYHARPIEGYTWLHGIKDGRMVHVGPVDSPISPNDIKQIAIEFKKAQGTGKDAPSVAAVDVLGWDFAFELNEIASQQAAQAGINVKFIRIPREVLEQKAVEQGDIKFFELAALSVDVQKKTQEVILQLTDFIIPPDDVPADVQKAITHWSQWIDYWAVDWDNKDDTFHNMWQAYRTRQDKTLNLKASHVYEEQGEYIVMVKVIDILGNDTTKTLKVSV